MPRVLLILGGGIAAYKALDVARELKRQGIDVTPVMTAGAKEFVTPLSLEVLCGSKVHDELFQPAQESQIGHIQLARSADLVLVCPATANLMARMAHGLADDLATTLLLATDAPILLAPAMNGHMWHHPATQDNLHLLTKRGVHFIGPVEGEMACGETGTGRLAEISVIVQEVNTLLGQSHELSGRKILVTAGPTVEPIDPVRYISNHSSGLQGFAIAEALARHGAHVTLVSGPVSLPTPAGVVRVNVQTAEEMLSACLEALPADVAICVAAVSDWRVQSQSEQKLKKSGDSPPALTLVENPDILATLSHAASRPALVVGFAAETEAVQEHARAKRQRKGCDWLLANDVSQYQFGGHRNQVCFFSGKEDAEIWPEMDKPALAERLACYISSFLNSSM